LGDKRVRFDLSIPNDLNNVQAMLKLLLYYVKTLPIDNNGEVLNHFNNNSETQHEKNSLEQVLETLIALEPNQLVHQLNNNNIYPRLFDQLLMKSPAFVRELVNLGHDDYSTKKNHQHFTKCKNSFTG